MFEFKTHVHHTKRSNTLAMNVIQVRRIAIESSLKCDGKGVKQTIRCDKNKQVKFKQNKNKTNKFKN